jgi:DNA-directed RNA polymerase specialized sigma24 family protein
MAESLPASRDIDRMRKELEKVSKELAAVNKNVKDVGKSVEAVDRKVDRSNATQLGALATALTAGTDVRPEVVLRAAGMSNKDIASALGITETSLRVRFHRVRVAARPKKVSTDG